MALQGLVERLDSYQRRHRRLGFPLAVVYKFYDDQGPYLAALITYYGFVSLFPLLLLLVTILGFVLSGRPQLQEWLLHSALTQFPILGDQIEKNVGSLHGSGTALVVGVLGTVYGGLGAALALQNALNRVWSVPRNRRPNPLMSRARSLLLIAILGAGVLMATALSALLTGAGAYGMHLGVPGRVAGTALSVLVNVVLLLAAFRIGTSRQVSTADIRTGAVIAAVAWQLLQTLGTYYLSHKLRGATQVYGLFGIVLGLLAWIYLLALILVLCAEVNVVRRDRLWPRALLAPVTEDVDLTGADKQAYESYATAERFKESERVRVSFPPHSEEGGRPEAPS